jgi:hypothetical protein
MTANDLDLYKHLNDELVSIVGAFGELVKSARIPEEDGGSIAGQGRRAASDLLEVTAEKTVSHAHKALHIIGQLRKGAVLSDYTALIENSKTAKNQLRTHADQSDATLKAMKRDLQSLLFDMEMEYYSSPHRGPATQQAVSDELQQLCELAMQAGSTRTLTQG